MFGLREGIWHFKPLKANSHITCRVHAVPLRV